MIEDLEEKVTLSNLGGGAAAEKFEQALSEALANCLDFNMDAGRARKVTLEVSMKPNDNRDTAAVQIAVKSTLAPPKAAETTFFIGMDAGKPVAIEHNPKQLRLRDLGPKGVINIKKGEIND